jgi:hypothetical protein
MSPTTTSKGSVLYAYPYIPGTETQWSGWNYYGKPGGSSKAPPRLANMELPAQHGRYLAGAPVRQDIDALSFDFDHDPSTLSRSRQIYDATSFDLRAFKARGGKILMWHGWADGAIMATSSIGYFEGVRKFMGGRDKTEDFFRLFSSRWWWPGIHRIRLIQCARNLGGERSSTRQADRRSREQRRSRAYAAYLSVPCDSSLFRDWESEGGRKFCAVRPDYPLVLTK